MPHRGPCMDSGDTPLRPSLDDIGSAAKMKLVLNLLMGTMLAGLAGEPRPGGKGRSRTGGSHADPGPVTRQLSSRQI